MNKLSHILIGPELLWFFFYVVMLFIIKETSSPIKSMDNFWVSTAYNIPLILRDLHLAPIFILRLRSAYHFSLFTFHFSLKPCLPPVPIYQTDHWSDIQGQSQLL